MKVAMMPHGQIQHAIRFKLQGQGHLHKLAHCDAHMLAWADGSRGSAWAWMQQARQTVAKSGGALVDMQQISMPDAAEHGVSKRLGLAKASEKGKNWIHVLC